MDVECKKAMGLSSPEAEGPRLLHRMAKLVARAAVAGYLLRRGLVRLSATTRIVLRSPIVLRVDAAKAQTSTR